MQEFKFDYDKENNDLFIYSGKKKSTASVELGDIVFDFDSKKSLSGIEIMNATKYLSALISGYKVSKSALANLLSCKVQSKMINNFLLIKIILVMKEEQQIPVNLTVPRITSPSPAIAS
ncbi:MAG: DUF2283 domain-containing protein [Candidatus Aenigmarchaeota archaeon]|nr:DUF2283 domain-containing protein [Candidatus Aenigmarchaeota archaeon]